MLTNRKITTYADNIKTMSDTPSADGINAEILKAKFDGRTDAEVKSSINGIVDDLVSKTDGASGADQIGATKLKDGGAETVQGQLEELKTDKVETSNIISAVTTAMRTDKIPNEKAIYDIMEAIGAGDMVKAVYDPTNQAKDIFLEISKVNESLSWSEILINPDFINPINTRGVSGTISTLGYFIGQWKLTSGTVTLTANGLQLNGTIAQIFEKDAPNTLPHLEMYSGTATASYDSGTKTLSITSSGGVIKYVNKPFSDKGTELVKCQRYYYPGISQWTPAQYVEGSGLILKVPVAMRSGATPTLITTTNKVYVGGTWKDITSAGIQVFPTEIQIFYGFITGLTQGMSYLVESIPAISLEL